MCLRFMDWLAWLVSVEPACAVVSATRHHSLCVTAENVPGNGHLLPSDHLGDVQPQTTGQHCEQLQSASVIEVSVKDAVDFKKSRIRPKATGIKSSWDKKNYMYTLGRGWCQEGIFELISDLVLRPQLGENTPLWRNCTWINLRSYQQM